MKCFQVSRANFSLKSYITRMTPLYREKTLITETITGNGAFVHTLPPRYATVLPYEKDRDVRRLASRQKLRI